METGTSSLLGLVFLCFFINSQASHHVCPYNFSSLNFAPAVSACREPGSDSDCCKHIEALILVAASQYAKSTGSLCLSRDLVNPCLNNMVAALDSNGVRPQASRFCGAPVGLKGHCLCKNVETVKELYRLAGIDQVADTCNKSCSSCSSAMVEKFTARFDTSRSCRYATVVTLASLGDSQQAVQQAYCFLNLQPGRQSSAANCPIKFTSWQLRNVIHVCKSSNSDPSACCSFSLLVLRVAASNLARLSGGFFMPQRQARGCIQDLAFHISSDLLKNKNSGPGRGLCSISPDSIFNNARKGCNNVLTLSELEHRLLDRSVNSSLVLKSCGESDDCSGCRTAALKAAYAAAWPYFDAVTLQSCLDLTLIMLASYSSPTRGTEIGGCLYSLPVTIPGGEDPVVGATPASSPVSQEVPGSKPGARLSSLVMLLAIGIGVTGASAALMFLLLVCVQRKREESMPLWSRSFSEEDIFNPIRSYRYRDIKHATNSFRAVIGQGKDGVVFRARFKDGLVAAVKRLRRSSQSSQADDDEFISEIHFLARLHHRHLVRLRGFCLRKHERFLVYDLLQNGSLKDHLSSGCNTLSWKRRMQIALEVATGLEYVHCYCEPSLCHRNVKSSNILLDSNFVAKVGDFRLSSAHAAGTRGYVDPEYSTTGKLTQKSDVYSYGVLLLELISAKPVSGEEKDDLVDWALSHLDGTCGVLLEVADPKLGGRIEQAELSRLVKVARLCTQAEARMRPSMKQVVNLLLDDSAVAFPPLCFNPRSTGGGHSADEDKKLCSGRLRCLSDDDTSLSVSVHSAGTLQAPSLHSNFIFGGPSSSFESTSFCSSSYLNLNLNE